MVISAKMKQILILFILMICVVPVSAYDNVSKSGTVFYSYSQSNSYSLADVGQDFHPDPIELFHLFTDAQILHYYAASGVYGRASGVNYSINSFTTFSASVDGVWYASGLVGLEEVSSGDVHFKIYFDEVNESYAQTLSGIKTIVLSYDSCILDDVVSSIPGGVHSGNEVSDVLTQSTPTVLRAYKTSYVRGLTYGSSFSSWLNMYYNDYTYFYNNLTGLSCVSISKNVSSSKWNLHNLSGSSYFYESSFNTGDLNQCFIRGEQVHANVTFNVDGGVYINTVLDVGGYDEDEDEDEDDFDFEYNITTELDEYSPGDTVNVTYTTDQKGTIQVVKTISGDIYHSIGFVSGTTNGTWEFYIAENEPYGFYDIYLLDSSNSILDSVRYSLLPTTSSLDILQSSVDLHETFVVFAQTVNESILSIEDPDGVEVWNESIGALMYDYIYYTPTIKQGIYTAYLYDDATLNDTVMVFLADPPIIDDPLDPETNGSIVVEDVLDPDESMTEYYNEKFRDFAPTIWGFFMLMCLLFLMSILTSFNSGGKRR